MTPKNDDTVRLDPNGICSTDVDEIVDEPKKAAVQIPLNQILRAIDTKDRDFYKNLDDEMKKKFSPFIMMKWAASVYSNNPDLERYYIESTNYHVNKNMFNLISPPGEPNYNELHWLLLTTISPGMGTQNHRWIKAKPKPKDAAATRKKKLAILFPTMKYDDLKVLAEITTNKELNQYIKDHGE